MSNLSLITKTEIQETGSASDEYKGFTVFSSLARGGYSFSIGLMLDENSDACHWICSQQKAFTIAELKSEAKEIINSFEFTAKQLLDIDSVIELSNYGNVNDEPKTVEQIINEELERQENEFQTIEIEIQTGTDFENFINDLKDFDYKHEIVCHPLGGYRLSFFAENNAKGTLYLTKYFLKLLGVEFEIDNSLTGFIFVKILSGQYKGFYDADFDYKKNQLNLFQDRG